MAKKVGPYVGVTGFMSRAEVDTAIAAMPPRFPWLLMVGVLASARRTFRAERSEKFPNRYPACSKIASIFIDSPRALNLIHFATDQPELLQTHLELLCDSAKPHLDGFQLNMAWPNPARIYDALHGRDLRVVLQIGEAAMEKHKYKTYKIAEAIDPYKGVVTDILIDSSGGKEEPLDPGLVIDCFRAIKERHINLGLGVAGGLSGGKMALISPIVRQYRHINIDAEGRLRTKEDHLDLDSVKLYLGRAAIELGF